MYCVMARPEFMMSSASGVGGNRCNLHQIAGEEYDL